MTPEAYVVAVNEQVGLILEARDEIRAILEFLGEYSVNIPPARRTEIRVAIENKVQAAGTALAGFALDPLP